MQRVCIKHPWVVARTTAVAGLVPAMYDLAAARCISVSPLTILPLLMLLIRTRLADLVAFGGVASWTSLLFPSNGCSGCPQAATACPRTSWLSGTSASVCHQTKECLRSAATGQRDQFTSAGQVEQESSSARRSAAGGSWVRTLKTAPGGAGNADPWIRPLTCPGRAFTVPANPARLHASGDGGAAFANAPGLSA